MPNRKIAVFTGSRAEYGLQYPILKALEADQRLEYSLVVSGSHLQSSFGNTIDEIEADGIRIYGKLNVASAGDSLLGTSKAIGEGIIELSAMLEELRPDFLMVYGDRFESFAAVVASSQMNIPVAHVEGGDYTEGGALDDSVRHAMTKLAHLHFTTNEKASERVRGLGEEAWRVHNVGLPVLDLVKDGNFASPAEVTESLELDLSRPIVLFCQHSIATEFNQTEAQITPSLEALRLLSDEGCQIVVTYPNNDAGGREIIEKLRALNNENLPGVRVRQSLGRYLLHGVLSAIGQIRGGAFVGNSSSGIKETPAFNCPAVNIGPRQSGRLRGSNVIDVEYDRQAIVAAVKMCIDDKDFLARCRNGNNPYGSDRVGPQIAEVLATVPMGAKLLQKKMTF